MHNTLGKTTFLLLALFWTVTDSRAQQFTNLFIFNGTNGSDPIAGLVLSGNTLYGTTLSGGTNNDGTVFAVNTDGSGFTNLYEFSGADGARPYGPLMLSGDILYGTTSGGGLTIGAGYGTVFAVSTDGTSFSNLFAFNNTIAADYGADSIAGLVLSGNTLYGTTALGGEIGTIFTINTDGTGFTNLFICNFTNSADGLRGGLALSGNTLYGITTQGGAYGQGAVFAIKTDGTGYTNFYSFSPTVAHPPSGSSPTNADGSFPENTLLLSGNILFGMTIHGGTGGGGTIFRVNTDGTSFSNLHSFTNATPVGSLILLGNTLYGTVYGLPRDVYGGGVFAVKIDGTGYTNIVGNSRYYDVAYSPGNGLVLYRHTLYGVQTSGGTFSGSVFAVTLPPPSLNIQLTNGAVILSWDDPTSTYSLQGAPNVGGIYTNVIGATSPFTNAITGAQTFFRLQSD